MKIKRLQQVTALDADAPVELVEAIWGNIASRNAASPITGPQQMELERRLDDYLLNPNDVSSWREVKAAAIQRAQKTATKSLHGILKGANTNNIRDRH